MPECRAAVETVAQPGRIGIRTGPARDGTLVSHLPLRSRRTLLVRSPYSGARFLPAPLLRVNINSEIRYYNSEIRNLILAN